MQNTNNNSKVELFIKLEALMRDGLGKQTLMLTNETREAPYKDMDVKNVYLAFNNFKKEPNHSTQNEFIDALTTCERRKRRGFDFKAIHSVAQTILPAEDPRPATPKLN